MIKTLKVYVFGNENSDLDNIALTAVKNIGDSLPNIDFVVVKPNEDLPFDIRQDVVIMDTVEGLTDIQLIKDDELDKIILSPRTTAHDYDLGFQLKYLKKLGKLGRVTIIGLPMREKINYNLLRTILRKVIYQA